MLERFVITDANIITMDASHTGARCLAVDDGRIVHVGSSQEGLDLVRGDWHHLPLEGKTVVPGFIDTHQHTMLTGLMATGIPLDDASDIAGVLERLRQAAPNTDKGAWIRGSYLNEQHLAEKRMPNRHELDRVSPDHPIFVLHATGHMCALNTRALELLRIPLDLEGYDQQDGVPTGVIRDPGILTFVHPALSRLTPEEIKIEALQKAARMALQKGITTLHCLDGGDLGPGDTQIIWRIRDRLPVRVVCYNQSMDLEEIRSMDLPRVGGCICADGAFEAHTAALFEPYADEPDNYGTLTYAQEVMDDFVLRAHREGLQIAIHCESDRSIEQVLFAMEKALRDNPRPDHRHRIEHLELPTLNQIARMSKAGIVAAMQPAFIPTFIGSRSMEIYEKLLGKPRLKRVHPYRTLLDYGVPVCGGSDSPVTPYDPLAGIHAAVNHPNPSERLSVHEALEMFTSRAAWSAFEEEQKGTLKPGKLADFVVLDVDPYQTPAHRLSHIKVEMTFVGGRLYQANTQK